MNRYRGAGNRPATFLMLLMFVLAAVALSRGPNEPIPVGVAIALVVIGVFIPQSLMIANQWERAVVLRMGRLQAIKGPGVFWIVPIIDRVATWLDQRIQTTEFNAEQALSKDTVPVNIDAVVFWQIHDPERAALEITDYRSGISRVAQTSLREMVGSSLLTSLLADRKREDEVLRDAIARKIADWGIAVLSVEIRDISVPAALQDAMSRQAQAERERLARVLLGQAEQEVAIKFVEAAEIYARSPAALQLRAMNIIYETTKERGATILMPSAMVDAMNPGAVMALAGLAGGPAAAVAETAPPAPAASAGGAAPATRARGARRRPPAPDIGPVIGG
ncbi:MAG TPA: slipin family protein [Caulobacteraceae bacterium]|jgi:regulator of protease activity HflC (stomatin/prohibitin superfamily)